MRKYVAAFLAGALLSGVLVRSLYAPPTIEWYGFPVFGSRDKDGIVTGSLVDEKIEIGLQSDGFVVWRRFLGGTTGKTSSEIQSIQ